MDDGNWAGAAHRDDKGSSIELYDRCGQRWAILDETSGMEGSGKVRLIPGFLFYNLCLIDLVNLPECLVELDELTALDTSSADHSLNGAGSV
ncbi:MAG: hypothetical protein D6690_16000 [Nitrospirae bacterium]|nr:MAG: hypothetical protein D6690_16000 [Nitrospirota bacterium]